MSNFSNVFSALADTTTTENGAVCYSTTGSELLNLFATIGGMRDRNEDDVVKMWLFARNEDKELADNLILYVRSIRGSGIGERKLGKLLLKQLAKIDPPKVRRNFDTIVNTGRWDDLYVFVGTPVEDFMFSFLKEQFEKDWNDMNEGKAISLLAKWLKSCNTSSQISRRLGRLTAINFGLSETQYRKKLSKLRAYLKILETKMSAGKWDEIDFSSVPSKAMNMYVDAFNNRCGERFQEYKQAVAEGKEKINAAALFPYDITQKYFAQHKWDSIYDEQWKALPNYLDGEKDILCIVDTSGSMTCDNFMPLSTSVGLGVYFAQRNKGDYHNMFMTFSSNPTLCKIKDEWTLKQCLDYVNSSDWGWSTDLDKAYCAIYDIAVRTMDVPAALVIISDMEIDRWSDDNDYAFSITEKWEKKFGAAGLKMPKLIYWNVAARNSHFLAKQSDNVAFVSGAGIGPFKNFLTLINKTAYGAMIEILSKEEFKWH